MSEMLERNFELMKKQIVLCLIDLLTLFAKRPEMLIERIEMIGRNGKRRETDLADYSRKSAGTIMAFEELLILNF